MAGGPTASLRGPAVVDLPECFAAWTGRANPASGGVFGPKTVVDKVDVAADTRTCLPAVFDPAGRDVIRASIELAKHPRSANNVHNDPGGVSLMPRAVTLLRKPDLDTMSGLHVRARGEPVESPDRGDTVFAVVRGSTPVDLDLVGAESLRSLSTVKSLPGRKSGSRLPPATRPPIITSESGAS